MDVKDLAAALLEKLENPFSHPDMNVDGAIDWSKAWRKLHQEADEGDSPAAMIEALRVIAE